MVLLVFFGVLAAAAAYYGVTGIVAPTGYASLLGGGEQASVHGVPSSASVPISVISAQDGVYAAVPQDKPLDASFDVPNDKLLLASRQFRVEALFYAYGLKGAVASIHVLQDGAPVTACAAMPFNGQWLAASCDVTRLAAPNSAVPERVTLRVTSDGGTVFVDSLALKVTVVK